MMLIIFPYVNSSSITKLKVTSLANLFTTLFYTLITFSCLIFFNAHELSRIPEPVPYLIKSLKLTLIERPDLFFITLWIVLVSTSFMNHLYSASKALKNLFYKKTRVLFVYLSAFCSLIISLIWNLKEEVIQLELLISNCGIIFIVLIPAFLLFLSIAKQQTEGVSHENN